MRGTEDRLGLAVQDGAAPAPDQLQETVEFLRGVYKMMPDALVVCDREGTIRAVNDAATSMLEYASDELVGAPIERILGPEHAIAIAEVETLAARDTVLRSERTCVTKGGVAIPVLFSVTALRRSRTGGDAQGIVCVAVDLRDRRRLEIELRQAQKLESVGRLAAGVAHEINTPTQFVSDSIHFLREGMTALLPLIEQYRAVNRALAAGEVPKGAVPAIAQAEQAADLDYLIENMPSAIDRALDGLGRITTIVRSMKEFAHPDQKEMVAVDSNQSIQSTLVITRNEYKYVADVETDFEELPRVTCHAGGVNQAILNIIVNAAHAIGDVVAGTGKKGRIHVSTRREGDFAVVRIADSGGGIPEAIRDRIFDPFFTTKEVGRGTGQGLAIARSVITEKHGGEFTFETEVGAGTVFVIRLPIDGRRNSTGAAA